jgi:hypothetical protein
MFVGLLKRIESLSVSILKSSSVKYILLVAAPSIKYNEVSLITVYPDILIPLVKCADVEFIVDLCE